MDSLREGPDTDSLVYETKDERKTKNDTAIIIPTCNNKVLQKAIKALSEQDTRDFDVLAVYGNKDEFIRTPEWASILHIRTVRNLGSAGAFYTGEKVATGEDYQNIILADDDCRPLSKDLIRKIITGLESSEVVLPIETGHGKTESLELLYHYGALQAGVYEEIGHTFFPMFSGGVDIEFLRRVKKRYRIKRIDATVYHPEKRPFYLCSGKERQRHYCKNSILLYFLHNDLARAFFSIAYHILSGVIFFPVRRGILWHCLSEVDRASEIDLTVGGKDRFEPFEKDNGYVYDIEVKKGFPLECMGKRVLLSGSMISQIVLLLVAGSAAITNRRETYVLTRERSAASLIMGSLLFVAAIPFALIISLVLTIRGAIIRNTKKIDPWKYGVRGRK